MAKKAVTGSANQAKYKEQAAAIKSTAEGNAKTMELSAGVVSGAIAEKKK